MKYQSYSFSEKYRFFCAMSKPGAKKPNGNLVSDFERGRYFERALMMRNDAEEYNKNKANNTLSNKNSKSLNMNSREYSDELLNSLFDNFKGLKDDKDSIG